ncbi:MAG: response regulator [Proteobacteria bacterium]|nr:response regulator [Pseudomonadota bacterium]
MTGLFNKVVTPTSQIKELLAYLVDNIPALTTLAVIDDGQRIPEEHYDAFPDDLVYTLALSIQQQRDTTQPLLTPDSRYICFPLPSLKTTLLCETNHEDFSPKGLLNLLRLAVKGYFDHKEVEQLNKKITIQKNQFNRKFQVMDATHQEMLEEAQNNYRIIQEQQDNYSQTLKTEIEKQTQELRKSKTDAESASVAKSQFLASMSHEIRTPMNGVIGFTDMLLATEMDEEQKDFALTIKRSGEALLGLINDILDFSKVEAGQMTLEYIDFDPEITAHDVCEMIRPRVAGKPIEVLCRIDDLLPANIKGDPGRYRQVLINLLGNAAKFTEKGELELSIEVYAETEETITLLAKIRDTGIGIREDKFTTIFEAFKQADGTTTRKYGGTGLGLSICKKIASLMNGEVWVESTVGVGTTFLFTAVMKKSSLCQMHRPAAENLKGQKVLVVDDNRANNEILRGMLEKAGMVATTLLDATTALAELVRAEKENLPFTLAILDLQMPFISGYDLAARIRTSRLANPAIPLLAYTSSTERVAQKCKDVGFNAFLTKPARRNILLRTLSRILGAKDDYQERPEEKKLVTQYSLREELKQSVRILLAEDNPVNQKLAMMMLSKAGYKVTVVANGRLAVETFTQKPEEFDTILMDIQMPEMDGYEATRQIRLQGFEDIPIIAMTANAMKGDKELCLEAGMNDYITKPVKREIIFQILEKWLNLRN